MGKYMRKGKVSGEVAVMEVAGALLGVRTRSRTLALQRMQKPPGKGEEDLEPEPGAADYLELRSRRLEKPHPPPPKEKEAAAAARRAASGRKEAAAAAEEFDAELEVSFGDNVLGLDAMERSTRETTPCSLIKNSETISTPGSTTRTSYSMSSRYRMETPVCRYIASSLEMEEFFAAAEQQQHQTFREKYNFCPVNDCPLPGRYEWARLDC